MKTLFLYTELADYFIHCCKELSKEAEVHIVRWPVNSEAPFQFDFSGIQIYNKNDYTFAQLQALLQRIAPDVIFCSGWIDRDYLKLIRSWSGKVPTVITLDTQWKGTLKQHVATLLSRFVLTSRFSHAWVPGEAQKKYARKLGFRPENIRTGFYCCDLSRFNGIYERTRPVKAAGYPKRFIYAGRYYEFKGVSDLWTAFAELQREMPNEWELWCLGTGSLLPAQHEKIRHFGFVQPGDLEPLLRDTAVFVLPSRFEPWAVVAQEFAAAGFPLLLSKEVGAREYFLEEGMNGFSFGKENVTEIKNSLKKIISLNVAELLKMGEHSNALAGRIHPAQWTATVKEIYASFRTN